MICINCNNEHDEKFCPNCGEKSEVSKITFAALLQHSFSTITNMDKGFLFNLKDLFLNPKKLVNDYILGKRKNILNPVTFLIISVTFYLISDSFIDISIEKRETQSTVYSIGYETGKFIKTNLKYFWILSVIWLSTSTKLLFGKYNFAEHLAMNSFVIGQSTLIGIIGLIIFKLPVLFNPIVYSLIIWMLYQIFKQENKKTDVFFKSFIAAILFFLQVMMIALFIGMQLAKSGG